MEDKKLNKIPDYWHPLTGYHVIYVILLGIIAYGVLK